MEVREAILRRRMTRSFSGAPLDEARVAALCEVAMRAPTAGHARGVRCFVLAGTAGVAAYLDAATDERWRATSSRARGFERAGAAVVVLAEPDRYASRYAEDDKASSGLGDPSGWPVPYWVADAGAFTMALLLLAEGDGLGACFLGAFRHAHEVLALVGAPEGSLLHGCVLLGDRAAEQTRSASLARPGPSVTERVTRVRP